LRTKHTHRTIAWWAFGDASADALRHAVTWRRCRRCQAQFDGAAAAAEQSACRFHPARFECGSGEPFLLRHVGSAAPPCAGDCDGRFPCCGARFRRSAADSNGCRTAAAHTP
jgi:hypothetical protein